MGEPTHGIPAGDRSAAHRAATPHETRPRSLAAGPAAARALALQRAAGNRATVSVLARWAAHPDKDKKGVMMPDALAAEYNRFNPPLGK